MKVEKQPWGIRRTLLRAPASFIGDNRPIGVFDSGVGGLTVLRELLRRFPHERFIYFGDTARVPYGTKSPETVLRYSREICQFLLTGRFNQSSILNKAPSNECRVPSAGPSTRRPAPGASKHQSAVKMVVIACNTASATAAAALSRELPVRVVEVTKAGAHSAAKCAPQGPIAVIGTSATIQSRIYEKHLRRLAPRAKVITASCPLLVPLAEEGWGNHQVTRQVAKIYLRDISSRRPQALILGCTHYPLIIEAIKEAIPTETQIIDSPTAVADSVDQQLDAVTRCFTQQNTPLPLSQSTLSAPHSAPLKKLPAPLPRARFFVTDDVKGFERHARNFLGGRPHGPVRLVNL